MEYYFLGRSSGKSGKVVLFFSDGMLHMEIVFLFFKAIF